jgi:5-methylcytosine-specific restriction endonuclease McrA
VQNEADATGGLCRQCGNAYERIRGKHRPREYCSAECRYWSIRKMAHDSYHRLKTPPQTPIVFTTCDDCGRYHARGKKAVWSAFVQAGGVLRCPSCAKDRARELKRINERTLRTEGKQKAASGYLLLVARENNKGHRRRVRIRATSDVSSSHVVRLRTSRKTCPKCRQRFSDDNPVTVDHIIPIAKGGTHTRDNLRVLCRSCNSSRGATMDDVSNFQLNLEMVVPNV